MEAFHPQGWKRVLGAVTLVLVASPVLVFAWAYGGMRGDVLRVAMPPATLACLLATVLLPQRHHGETYAAACRRVCRNLLGDPFLWTSVALLALLAVSLFNVGLSPLVDATAITRGQSPLPPWPHLPFCVNRAEHAGVLYWFGPTLVAALGVRHALTRAGKRRFFELMVWNAALLALLGFVQIVTGAHFPYWGEVSRKTAFFSVFSYANMAGAYFTLAYACSLGLWVYRLEAVERTPLTAGGPGSPADGIRWRAHYPALATALLLAAVLATYCRAAIVLTLFLTGLFAVYLVFRPLAETGVARARRFRSALVVGGLLLALAGVVYVYAPTDLGRELKTVNAFSVSDRVTGKGQYHTRIATAIMRDYPLFGVGGWGYRHFCTDYLKREKGNPSLQIVGGANVHNDYLQFLAEHGAVGFALMVLSFALLLKPMFRTWQRLLVSENDKARKRMGASTLALFVVEAPVLWLFLGLVAVLIHAFGDCPLRAASVLSLLYVLPASVLGFLPRFEEVAPRVVLRR